MTGRERARAKAKKSPRARRKVKERRPSSSVPEIPEVPVTSSHIQSHPVTKVFPIGSTASSECHLCPLLHLSHWFETCWSCGGYESVWEWLWCLDALRVVIYGYIMLYLFQRLKYHEGTGWDIGPGCVHAHETNQKFGWNCLQSADTFDLRAGSQNERDSEGFPAARPTSHSFSLLRVLTSHSVSSHLFT